MAQQLPGWIPLSPVSDEPKSRVNRALQDRTMGFGKLVRERRMVLDLSQQQLADACGLTREVIASIESGRLCIYEDSKSALSEALRCDFVIELRER